MIEPIPFGKYYLLDRINSGGMAEVFRAKAFGVEGFERIVAVKRILPNIASDTNFITMFIDEAKIAVQLNHANIAQIFDLGKVGSSYFIALEYVHGKDARAVFDLMRLRDERVPVAMACYIVMKTCEGLDYAHNKCDATGRPLDLVHRDVSPQNVLISFDGDIKLIDFGIAKAAGKAGKTRAGILKGKFGYLSPEQVRGEHVDRRSDIFSVGTVFYELLTGRRLFAGDTDFSSLEKVRSAEIVSPVEYNEAIPEELAEIVMRALERDRGRRFQTAMELHDCLRQFLYGGGGPFGRRELSAWMRAHFPADAANDQEAVGDLQGIDVVTEPEAVATPIAESGESIAVIDDTREIPSEGSVSKSSTLLGMSAALARSGPGRTVPPPPPRSAAAARSVPPPPPRSAPPAPIPSIASQGTPQRALPPAPPAAPASEPPSFYADDYADAIAPAVTPQQAHSPALDMDWDDEELSTQVYDRPEDQLDAASFAAPQYGPASQASVPTYIPPPPAGDYDGYGGYADDGRAGDGRAGYGQGAAAGYSNGNGNGAAARYGQDAYAQAGAGYYGSEGYEPVPASGYGAPQPVSLDPFGEPDAFGPADPYAPPAPFDEPSGAYPPAGYAQQPHAYTPVAYPAANRDSRPVDAGIQAAPVAKQPSRAPLYALAGGAVALLCFIAYVFLVRTEPGVVQLTTHPSDAKVLFDGESVGQSSPFLVTGVSPGQKHMVEVSKEGYRAWSQEVQVQPGQTLEFPVTLEPAGAASGGEAAGDVGSFTLETEPAGANVFLDGEQLSGKTPLRVGNLVARAYEVRIELPDYRTKTLTVDVVAGVDKTLPQVALEPKQVRLRISSDPSGAQAVLKHGDEKRVLGATPVDVTLDNDSVPWELEVTRDGFEPFTKQLSFEGGSQELAVRAMLRAREGAQPAPEVKSKSPAPRRAAAPARSSTSSAAGAAPRSAAAAGEGTLRINSRPWSQITIDGQGYGTTPQMNIKLSAGRHRVTLVNPDFGIRKTLTVTIKPDAVETLIVPLQ